jgi:hypothetical protein
VRQRCPTFDSNESLSPFAVFINILPERLLVPHWGRLTV